MKKSFVFLLLFFLFSQVYGQGETTCTCTSELDDVHQLIKLSKSYKDQVQNKKEKEFEAWKEQVNDEVQRDPNIDHFCVAYLNKFISFIKDVHNQIYFDYEKIPADRPSYAGEIDSLERQLQISGSEAIEGIYYQGKTKVALIQSKERLWEGVILNNDLENWKQGEIRFQIKGNEKGNFEMFEYISNGQLLYRPNVAIKDGRIYPTFWNKSQSYHFHKGGKQNFEFKEIDESTDYISLKTFRRTKELMKEINSFYKETLPKLNKPVLIVDLRNNGGGAPKQAEPLLKFLKKKKAISKIYVMMNFMTASAAEITALNLKKNDRVVLVGENSKGMLAYGYGNQAINGTTKCLGFETVFTIEKMNNSYLKYEAVGITPDIYLNIEKDWVEQISALGIEK